MNVIIKLTENEEALILSLKKEKDTFNLALKDDH